MTVSVANHRLVVINQAANYLTIDLANAFVKMNVQVTLVTGSVHVQGEELDPSVEICSINRWIERPALRKALSYATALLRMWWLLMTRFRRHEVLFVSVPPMGYLLNLILPHRFSMVIWDVYPDTLKVTGMQPTHWLYRFWAHLNRRSFARAYRLFTISRPMTDLLAQYVQVEKLIVHPLWSIFQENQRIPPEKNLFLQRHGGRGKFIVQYSGNIGQTHNLEVLLEVASLLREDERIILQIIGRGPRLPHIQAAVERRALSNVELLPFQTDAMFPHSLSAASLGIVILDERVSRGSVPSKTYNLMSLGIPSLYVATQDSELASYVKLYDHGACFRAAEITNIVNFIREIASDKELYTKFSQNAEIAAQDFRRENAIRFVNSYLND